MKQVWLAMILAALMPQEAPNPRASIASMVLEVDAFCILRSWRIVGVYACPTPTGGVNTCLIIENAHPVGVLEVVRKPFATHLIEMGAFFNGFKAQPRHGRTSSHTSSAGDATKLQFAEAHAYEFVPQLLIDTALPLAKPRGSIFRVSYLSELDGYFWRSGIAELLTHPDEALKRVGLPACSVVPRPQDCAWTWGPWFPRIGFVTHPSEVIASHVAGLRAARVAAKPQGRIALAQYPYEPRSGHYVQMIRPSKRACVSIGSPLVRRIEAGALSLTGEYLFIHFGIFRECRGCYPAQLVESRPPVG